MYAECAKKKTEFHRFIRTDSYNHVDEVGFGCDLVPDLGLPSGGAPDLAGGLTIKGVTTSGASAPVTSLFCYRYAFRRTARILVCLKT
jgi:hypothetical protein